MMWNNNDTKYIIKRLILYFLITGIVFFAGQKCANAAVNTVNYQSVTQLGNIVTIELQGQLGKGMGQGYAIGTIWLNPANDYNYGINEITAEVWETNATAHYTMECEIGNMSGYTDNTTNYQLYSYKCPANLNNNVYIRYINIRKTVVDNHPVISSKNITYVTQNSEANAIISGQQQAIQNQINNDNVNAQAIQNAINSSTQQEINAINNQTQATNDNTAAINDLNDNIMADYNGPSNSDIDAINSLDGIFTNEDKDVIRGVLLFPTRLFIILASALDSNSCVTYSFGYLLGTEIYLPCLNYKSIIGNNLYNIIDIVFGLCVLYGLVRYIIHLYDFIFSVGLKGGVVVAAVEVFK